MRDQARLTALMAQLEAEVGGTGTFTPHEHGWELQPLDSAASPIHVLGMDSDVTVAFGRHGARVEFSDRKRDEPGESARQVERVTRAVIAGGLRERWIGESESRWVLQFPDGTTWSGSSNWTLPWVLPWRTVHEHHYRPWT